MDSAARLAAVEAVQRSGGSGQPSSPVVINNNNNNNSTAATTAAAAAAPAAAPAGAVMVAPTAVVAPALVAPRAPAVLYHEQRCEWGCEWGWAWLRRGGLCWPGGAAGGCRRVLSSHCHVACVAPPSLHPPPLQTAAPSPGSLACSSSPASAAAQ